MSFNIEVESGKSVRLPTAGKYCDRDIVVTATGGGGGSFWDSYQDGGNRTNYQYGFYGIGWNEDTFAPQYPIVCKDNSAYATSTFARSRVTKIDVPVILEDVAATETFYYAQQLREINHIVLIGVTAFTRTLTGCSNLTRFIVKDKSENEKSVIDVSISFSTAADLDGESAQSIIDHLADLTGKTRQTLTFHNRVGSNLTEEQKAVVTSKNWELVY